MTRPIGIKLLMIYSFVLLILYLIYMFFGINMPIAMLFGSIVKGNLSLFINIIITLTTISIIYGFYLRKSWAFEVSLAFFSLSILSSLISMFFIDEMKLNIVKMLTFATFLSIIVINTLILLYIYLEKDYFKSAHYHGRELQYRDKVFVYTLIVIWGMIILVISTIGISFYQKMMVSTDNVIPDLMKKDQYAALNVCDNKIGEDKDVCYLIVVNSQTLTKAESIYACEKIKSDFYRFTCYQSLTGIKYE